jgi:hypothetical protein
MKLKKILLFISLIVSAIYIITTTINYGWLGSISESAKYWQKDDGIFFFYSFIWVMCFCVGFAAYSGISAFATAFLTIIGIWTGYNVGIDVPYQHTLHIIVTILAIITIFIDVFNKGLKDSKVINSSLTSIVLLVILGTIIFVININPIFWIEVLAILIVHLFYYKYLSKK